jgi:hypothetical protein
MEKNLKILQSFTISAIVTIIFVALITIFSELSPPLKDWLKATFIHHWIGKGIISIGIFSIFGLLGIALPHKANANFWLKVLSVITILGFLAILGFYMYHYYA